MHDYFGRSAIVCQNENETNGPYNFIPVQRIAYRCAHLQMKLDFDDFDETVFIAGPLPIRHSILYNLLLTLMTVIVILKCLYIAVHKYIHIS